MRPISDLSTPPSPNGKEVLVPTSAATWQQWLADNADRTEGVWVVYRKAKAPLEGPVYPELLDEALCAGWIDSRVAPVDDERTMQWFSPRRKGSIWSARNRARIAVLQEEGRLTENGRAAIAAAKADGSWESTDPVDSLEVPEDLAEALSAHPEASEAMASLSESHRKRFLWWIHSAKRPETRAKRIVETVRRLTEGDLDGT